MLHWMVPRFVASGRVSAVAVIAVAIGYLTEKPKVIASLVIIVGVIVVVEVATAGLMMHPANPIGASPSLTTKAFYYATVVVVLALVVEMSRLLTPLRAEQRM